MVTNTHIYLLKSSPIVLHLYKYDGDKVIYQSIEVADLKIKTRRTPSIFVKSITADQDKNVLFRYLNQQSTILSLKGVCSALLDQCPPIHRISDVCKLPQATFLSKVEITPGIVLDPVKLTINPANPALYLPVAPIPDSKPAEIMPVSEFSNPEPTL